MFSYDKILKNKEKICYDYIILYVYVYNFFIGMDLEFEELWGCFLYKLRICRVIGLKIFF